MDDSSAAAVPLFAYEEEGDTVFFFPPRTVDLVRRPDSSGHSCQEELPDLANLWGGSEIESAFLNAEVQQALRATLPAIWLAGAVCRAGCNGAAGRARPA